MAARVPVVLFAIVVTAVLGILAVGPASAAAPPFEPGAVMCFESLESGPSCDGDTSPGAPADIRLTFCVGWNEDCSVRDTTALDSAPGGLVAFTPAAWGVPKGDTIPIGAIAGRIDAEESLGLLNNPCNNRLSVSWTLLNGSINVGDKISPRPEGGTDVMQPLAMDANGNGIPDGADRYPSYLAQYFSANGTPEQPRSRLFGVTQVMGTWVTQDLVTFEPGTTIWFAQSVVTFDPALGYPTVIVTQDPTAQDPPSAESDQCSPESFDLVVLGKTLNNPCTPAPGQGANCPVTSDTDPEIKGRGYPSFPCDAVSKADDDEDGVINDGCPQAGATAETGAECSNDISDDVEDADPNDGCPPVGDVSEGSRIPGTCSAADEGGCNHRSNPTAAGGQTFTLLAVSQRDTDGDGIENGLDVCFDKSNSEWNPRAIDPANDPDMDGLPSVCDPNPAMAGPGSPTGCFSGYTGADEDQDCYSNRQDNCPTIRQLKDPTEPPDNFPSTNTNPPLAPDSDGDGIGDACDPDRFAPNGDYTGDCIEFSLNVGASAGPVVGVRGSMPVPECTVQCSGCTPETPTPTPVVIYERYSFICSVNGPVAGPMATPSELSIFTSDVAVYATLSGFTPTTDQTITFSDETGLGTVDVRNVVTGNDGVARTTYRLPADLTGQAVAIVTARRGADVCSVSFLIKPPPIVLPRAGGDAGSGTSGAWMAMAGVAVGLAGAAALLMARSRRTAFNTAGGGGGRRARSRAIVLAGLIAAGAAAALLWQRVARR